MTLVVYAAKKGLSCPRPPKQVYSEESYHKTRFFLSFFFSEAHRPQVNGRAGVAGKVICDMFRYLKNQRGRETGPWVELLPMVVRPRQYVSNPETGLIPYQWEKSA